MKKINRKINFYKKKRIFIPLDSSFCWRSLLNRAFRLGGLLFFGTLISSLLACNNLAPTLPIHSKNATIEQLIANLDQLKKQSGLNSNPEFGQQVQVVQSQQALYTKSAEELRNKLLSDVNPTNRQDFYSELQNIWKVGKEQVFFKRQISYCQTKLDLAVVPWASSVWTKHSKERTLRCNKKIPLSLSNTCENKPKMPLLRMIKITKLLSLNAWNLVQIKTYL